MPARPWRDLWWRLPLAASGVWFCYRFSWAPVRSLTSEAAMDVARAFGVPAHRLAFDTIEVGSVTARFSVSCTLVDVFWVGLVLMWSMKAAIAANLGRAALFAVGLFALNQARLIADYIVFTARRALAADGSDRGRRRLFHRLVVGGAGARAGGASRNRLKPGGSHAGRGWRGPWPASGEPERYRSRRVTPVPTRLARNWPWPRTGGCGELAGAVGSTTVVPHARRWPR